MSGLIKTQLQLGDSATATNNFTLDSSAANGTMKLARGEFGVTTQDILTIAATGAVDFPALARSFGTSGYYTLPGGLIIQWGSFPAVVGAGQIITFNIAFPVQCFGGWWSTDANHAAAEGTSLLKAYTPTQMTFDSWLGVAANIKWIAIGN